MPNASGTQLPRVAVVAVTWNSKAYLPGFFAGLAEQGHDADLEIIVIDNASADGSATWVHAEAPHARVISNPDNRGLSAANNQGILASTSPYLLICNPDTRAHPGAVRAMLDVLEAHPRAGVVIPRLEGVDGERHVSVGAVPTVGRALLGRRVGVWLARTRGSAVDADLWWDDWPHDAEEQVPRGAEAFYLVRRSALAEVGLQDERYPLDWEGVDWADRFARVGWEVWFTPRARAVHEGGASIRQAQARWVVTSHRGLRQFCRSRAPRPLRPAVSLVVAGRAGAKLLLLASGRDAYGIAQATLRRDV